MTPFFSTAPLFVPAVTGRYDDYPGYAGVATSRDLIHWTKYAGNPIFSHGEPGQWDEGAIWFATVEKIDGIYYMWYEGYGGGRARWKPYGSYLKGGKSQVGLATLAGGKPIISDNKIIEQNQEILNIAG